MAGGATRTSGCGRTAPTRRARRRRPGGGGAHGRDTDVSNNKGFFSQVAGSLYSSPRDVTHSARRDSSGGGKGGGAAGGGDGALSSIFFEHCTAEGENLTTAFPKQVSRFVVRARDRLFRPVACSPEPFHVVVRGKQIVTPTMFANADGSITVEYTIAVCGTYKVHVRGGKKGQHVVGSPFSLNVKAAPPSSGQCVAEGVGLKRARAGEPGTFVLHRRDSNGRLIPKGTSRFVIAFAYGEEPRSSDAGAKGKADGAFTWKVVDKGDGTFHVNYATERAGSYRLHVTLGLAQPVEIHGSPFVLQVEPGPVSAAQCELTAPLTTPLSRLTKAPSRLQRGADGSVQMASAPAATGEPPPHIMVGKPFYLRLIARDALSNDINVPEDPGIKVTATSSAANEGGGGGEGHGGGGGGGRRRRHDAALQAG